MSLNINTVSQLNLGLPSIALGKEPLAKSWLQRWVQPVDKEARIFSALQLGPTGTKKDKAALESKKKNFARVRIYFCTKRTYKHTVKCAMCRYDSEQSHLQKV